MRSVAAVLLVALSCSSCASVRFSTGSAAGTSIEVSGVVPVSASKPKYGSEITLLSKSHDHIRESAAPDYWALSPYYVGQRDAVSCSLAAVVMVLNAARRNVPQTVDDELVTQDALFKRVDDPVWNRALGPGGRGVTLEELAPLLEKSLKAYGVKKFSVEVGHFEKAPEAKRRLREVLSENERSARDFIIANFVQGVFTGDADIGHLAPVGAYDEKRDRVLVLDPDRVWYEPYWVSEETFFRGMNTRDPISGKSRGFLWVKLFE